MNAQLKPVRRVPKTECAQVVELKNRESYQVSNPVQIGDSHHRNHWIRSDLAKAVGRDFACLEQEDALWPPSVA